MKTQSNKSKPKKTWTKPASHKVEIAAVTKGGFFSCTCESGWYYFSGNGNGNAGAS